jgi:thioredoxin 1
MGAAVAAAADVATISHAGEAVDVTRHLAPGKLTLVDFYADWCGPCRALEPTISDLATRHADRLGVRKVNIVNWDSAVSQAYRLRAIPHLQLYSADGTLIANGDAGAVLAALEQRLGSGSTVPAARSGSAAPFLAFLALVAGGAGWYFFRSRPAPAAVVPLPGHSPHPATADPAAVWFVMLQGTMQGPFTVDELDDLRRRRCVSDDAQVRRRGDAAWRHLADVC